MFKIDKPESLIRDWVRERVTDIPKLGKITLHEYNRYVMNSYERNYLFEYLDDEAILEVCNLYNDNVTTATRYPSTYEETIISKLFPELIQRFKEKV